MAKTIESAAFRDGAREREADALGMWVFLASEALLFGAVILTYLVARLRFPEAFGAASRHTSLWLGTANTAVLLTSSFTMALADVWGRVRRWNASVWLLVATLGFGCAFLVIKFIEYAQDYREGLAPVFGFPFHYQGPDAEHAQLFFSLYFAATGLHALHLIAGILVILLMLLVWQWTSEASCRRRLLAIGLYWHFVDIVWVFLFPILYLIR